MSALGSRSDEGDIGTMQNGETISTRAAIYAQNHEFVDGSLDLQMEVEIWLERTLGENTRLIASLSRMDQDGQL